MKGVNKCYGLLLVFFIMLGLSLNISLDVSALKYQIDTLPFWIPINSSLNPNFAQFQNFSVTVEDTFDVSFMYQFPVFSYGSDDSFNCNFIGHQTLPLVSYSSRNNLATYYYGFSGTYGQLSGYDPCLSILPLDNPYSINTGSVPGDFSNLASNLKPYRVKTSGIYRTSSGVLSETGVTSSTKFDLMSIFNQNVSDGFSNHSPDYIESMVIPFGYPKNYSDLSFGDSLLFEGDFIIDGDNPDLFELDSMTSVSLKFLPVFSSGSGTPEYGSCSNSISSIDIDDTGVPVYLLHYSCSFTLPNYDYSVVFPYFQLSVNFVYGNDYDPSIPEYTKIFSLIFDSSYVVTNNDWTDGGSFSYGLVGSDVKNSLGSIYHSSVDSSETDFFGSITNLFNFSFINPFIPIFGMFANSDSCVNIPILSGLLHSNSSQVCPFFDSNVRNILTPVFTLSSMMLVFGFAVRWLGSGSGNMFTDDIKDTGGNYSLFNKYRRNH